MRLRLNGTFWPTVLPLFHGLRWTASATARTMVSHRVEGQTRGAATIATSLSWINLGSTRPPGPLAAYWLGRQLTVPAMSRRRSRAAHWHRTRPTRPCHPVRTCRERLAAHDCSGCKPFNAHSARAARPARQTLRRSRAAGLAVCAVTSSHGGEGHARPARRPRRRQRSSP